MQFHLNIYKFFFNSIYQSIYYIYIPIIYIISLIFISFKFKSIIYRFKEKKIGYQNMLEVYNNLFK